VEDGAAPVEAGVMAPDKPIEDEEEEMPVSELGNAEGIRAVQQAFSSGSPRWPMYIRQAKQFLRGAIENFDERRYGFASVVDLLRAAAKTGVVRIERDRQGGMRVFPGANLNAASAPPRVVTGEAEVLDVTDVATEAAADVAAEPVTDIAAEPPIVDAEVAEPQPSVAGETIEVQQPAVPRTRTRTARSSKGPKASKAGEPKTTKPPRASGASGRTARARKSARTKPAEAADS